MNESGRKYAELKRQRVEEYLNDAQVMPWFIRQLIPAPDPERRPFSLGVDQQNGHDAQRYEADPLVMVAARQYQATRGALQGAPESVASSATTPAAAVAWITHILSALDPMERRRAISLALSRASGPRQSHVPFFACIPDDATQPQASALIDGLGTLMLSLGASGAADSVSTVAARAASIASRQPFASDPNTIASPSDVSLAKMLLDAYLADETLRDEIFRSDPFRQALEAVTAEAAGETAAAVAAEANMAPDLLSPDELELQRRIYDCIVHQFPLGGEPYAGGKLGDWLKKAAGKVKQFFTSADKAAGDNYAKERESVWRERLLEANPDMSAKELDAEAKKRAQYDSDVKYGRPDVSSSRGLMGRGPEAKSQPADSSQAGDTPSSSDEAAESLDAAVMETKQLIDNAIAQIAEARGSLDQQKQKLHSDALDYAKLLWASELLASSDDVAEILAGVRPNASDPSAFITSVLSVLPAAKASGNLTTLKALANAVRAAASKSGMAEGSILSMLSGDPDGPAEDDLSTPQAVASAIAGAVRQSWGMADTGGDVISQPQAEQQSGSETAPPDSADAIQDDEAPVDTSVPPVPALETEEVVAELPEELGTEPVVDVSQVQTEGGA